MSLNDKRPRGDSNQNAVTFPFASNVVCRKKGLYWLFPSPGAMTLITPRVVLVASPSCKLV